MQPRQSCVSYVLPMLPILPPPFVHAVVVVAAAVVVDIVSMALVSVEIMPYVLNDDHP